MDQIGSDMLLDSEYDEKQDVAIISTDEAMDDADAEPDIRADDYDAMVKKYMPELPDLETDSDAHDTWYIENWRSMGKKEHGPVFQCGGHPWRILFFPTGNNVEFASFYLEHGFEEKPSDDWYACVQFMLVLWNPNDPSIFTTHTATHRFTADESDWGFTRFAELRRLFASSWDHRGRPMVERDSCNVTAYVRVLKDPTGVLWHNFVNYDSKKETGMVGLKNQGATCYLNSLLQSLYFTPRFRKAVYQIPTQHEENPRAASAYALQRLFFMLQTNNFAVATNELTAAFGWDSKQIFDQQDVQELSRILMERLEEKMKGTEAENALSKMFSGKMKTYISCINVEYESSRIEDFWDIQLNVSGCKNLDDSFRDYVQVETMDGENKYFAEGFGLQDAKKGVIFETFPEVLHLQLKRFEYDINRDAMMKVNDRYEFPEVWDASPYLSDKADRSEPYTYHLHGVLVHSGDLNAGHYYAFIKPNKEGHFYKFDDDRVTRATKKEALDENFGGEYAPNGVNGNAGQRNPYTRTWSTKRSMSAYMLVYIRESRLDHIFLTDQEVEPPQHLAKVYAQERAALERKRKEREEAHLYMEIQVATEENFRAYQGFDIASWREPEGPAFAPSQKVLKTTTLGDFISMVATKLDRDPEMMRPWVMVNRQNGTVRPDAPLLFRDMTVEEAAMKHGMKNNTFKLWFEESHQKDENGKPIWGETLVDLHGLSNNKPILLFLKHFDPESQTLLGVGHFYAAWHDKVSDLSTHILKLMDWPAGTTLKCYEEIKPTMVEIMKPKITLAACELQDGDIITVQKPLSEKTVSSMAALGNPTDVREFYDYILNRHTVWFMPKVHQEEDQGFTLTLNKKMTYDQFAAKVGEHLSVDPTHLRFHTVNSTNGRAKTVVKRTPQTTLNTILMPSYHHYGTGGNQRHDALYYEILELSLSELDLRKNIKLTWLPEGIIKEEPYEVLVTKAGNLGDVLDELQRKTNISDEVRSHLRIYEVHGHKIYKVISEEYPVASLNEFVTIFVEKIPEEELKLEETDRLINAFHFDREPNKPHNIPFVFTLKQGEIFKETKERLSRRTGIKGKQFDKIKFAVVPRASYSKPEYLSDDDILSDRFTSKDDLLGLDHPNKTKSIWSRSDSIFIR
ncbi:cysteine proteinase [Patellaria atrata CBS 101060]|uniref:ubiquitinyl hydrolase 1 n=1 Tax=Patellaria atrata CBS 101060 TaxID=1346257 RepID=A0A9P4SEJ4_9PEZI|nr:cysteine proteinase [Patellaria atrata CBS 101060]